jgi:Protein O-mannosyl-transferase TMEM260-like
MPTPTPTRHEGLDVASTDWRDVAWAIGAALVAVGVYIRTLAPGLVGVPDTPMFQFIGRVLGVAHNPGYPLYVFLTFPFSYLPIGSLAYRINLFSALLGAIAVGLTYLLARRLECRRLIALAAALGLAFGQVFWSQAVIAEVYTLHAAIVAGILLALLAWSDTGQMAYYYTAVALFSAGLGNHTTLVGFVPGIAIFVLSTNPSFALRWRTIAATLGIVALGFLQYVFVLVRSLDPNAYVESRATTLAELLDVMLAGQFRDRLFAFAWRTVLFDRLPFLFERVLVPELTLPALGVGLIGAGWLLRRRLAAALLLLVGMAAILMFALNYSVVDTPVFVIPAFLVLWVVAAVGAERLARLAEDLRASAWPGAAVAALTLIAPAWLLAHNFASNDRSWENTSAVALDALFDALPDGSAIVHEDFLVDRMVTAWLLGDDGSPDRPLELLDRDARNVRRALSSGRRVFGFSKSARRLRYDALDFSLAPAPLLGGTFADFVAHVSPGSAVAIAVPAAYANRLPAAVVSLAAVGGTATANRVVGAGQPIGNSGVVARSAVDLRADATGAAIRLGGRDIVRTSEGVAVAVFSAEGRLNGAFVLRPDTDFRVPLPIGPLSIYALRENWQGHDIGQQEWRDVTEACRTGSILLRVPPGRTVVLYAVDDRPLEPRAFDKSQDRIAAQMREVMPGFSPRAHLYRIAIGVSSSRTAAVLMALGGIPSRVVARMLPPASGRDRATLFSIDTAGLLRTPDQRSELLVMARDEQSQLTGDGWSSVDFDVVGPYRWMTAPESALVMPIAAPGPTHVRVQALRRPGTGGPTTMGLRINGTTLPAQPMQSGWHAYEWRVPETLTHQGPNEMAIVVDRLPDGKAVAVSDVRLERRP